MNLKHKTLYWAFLVICILGFGTTAAVVRYSAQLQRESPQPTKEIEYIFSLENCEDAKKTVLTFVARFEEENENYTVNTHFVMSDNEGVMKALLFLENSDKAIVASLKDTNLFNLIHLNAIATLDNRVLSSKGLEFLQWYDPYALRNSVYNGYLWSLPHRRNSMLVYYSNEKAGTLLDGIEKPSLFNLFKETGQYRNNIGFSYRDVLVELITKQPKTNGIQQEMIQGVYLPFNFVSLDMLKSRQLEANAFIEKDEEKIKKSFIKGNLPIYIARFNEWPELYEKPEFDVLAKKFYVDDNNIFPPETQCFYLFKSSEENEQSAWTFIDWFTNIETANEFAEGLDSVSFFLKDKILYTDERKRLLAQYSYDSYSDLAVYEYPKVRRMIEEMLESVLFGKSELNIAEKNISKKTKVILESYTR